LDRAALNVFVIYISNIYGSNKETGIDKRLKKHEIKDYLK
jgi:hypothetical protein